MKFTIVDKAIMAAIEGSTEVKMPLQFKRLNSVIKDAINASENAMNTDDYARAMCYGRTSLRIGLGESALNYKGLKENDTLGPDIVPLDFNVEEAKNRVSKPVEETRGGIRFEIE